MQVVAETDEPFVPLPDDLLVNLSESRAVVAALLDNLAPSFAANSSVSLPTSPLHIRDRLVTSGLSRCQKGLHSLQPTVR